MSYLEKINTREYEYICDVIHFKEIQSYFKSSPKGFSKIQKGFRPEGITEKLARKILKENKKEVYVSSFVEKLINIWIDQIKKEFDKSKDEDFVRKNVAILKDSYFSNMPQLYFKLIDESIEEDTITKIKEGINTLNTLDISNSIKEATKNEIQKLKIELAEKEKLIKKNNKEYKSLEKQNNNLKKDNADLQNKIGNLSQEISSKKDISSKYEKVNKEKQDLENKNKKLETEIYNEKSRNKSLENDNKELKNKYDAIKRKFNHKESETIMPTDADEFEFLLEDNLCALGLNNEDGLVSLLSHFLKLISFNGKPILICKDHSEIIINAINYTLLNGDEYKKINYNSGVKYDDILEYESISGRIACFDCFIGNYNEIEFVPLIENNKGKITFFTTAYERTLNYVSNEFLKYCYYINLSYISKEGARLNTKVEKTRLKEAPFKPIQHQKNKYNLKFEKILNELNINKEISDKYQELIDRENDFVSVLFFFVIPYCKNVLKMDPFIESNTLLNYCLSSKYSDEFRGIING